MIPLCVLYNNNMMQSVNYCVCAWGRAVLLLQPDLQPDGRLRRAMLHHSARIDDHSLTNRSPVHPSTETLVQNGTAGDNGIAGGALRHPVLAFLVGRNPHWAAFRPSTRLHATTTCIYRCVLFRKYSFLKRD